MKPIKKILLSVLLFVLITILYGCNKNEIEIQEDEVVYEVTLNTEDTVYIISMDVYIKDDIVSRGGTRNADKSKLNNDEKLYFRLKEGQEIPEGSNINSLIIKLFLSDNLNYVDDYENLDKHVGQYEVTNKYKLNIQYGYIYRLNISGNKINGYIVQISE